MTDDANAARAARIAEVRATLELTQQGMADRLNAVAARLHLPVRYTGLSISQRETGRLRLDEEDYAVVSALPEGQGRWTWEWLAFGRPIAQPIERETILEDETPEPTVDPRTVPPSVQAAGDRSGRRGRGA